MALCLVGVGDVLFLCISSGFVFTRPWVLFAFVGSIGRCIACGITNLFVGHQTYSLSKRISSNAL